MRERVKDVPSKTQSMKLTFRINYAINLHVKLHWPKEIVHWSHPKVTGLEPKDHPIF